MNNQKPQKPTLSGQRFKTRKRGKRAAARVLSAPAVGAACVAFCGGPPVKSWFLSINKVMPLCSSHKSFK